MRSETNLEMTVVGLTYFILLHTCVFSRFLVEEPRMGVELHGGRVYLFETVHF